MRYLITGGCGFIGSAVIRHIIRNTDLSVVNVDKLTYAGNRDSLQEVFNDRRYSFEEIDICDRTELDRVFRQYRPDAVMHLAAESHVDRSIDGPAAFIQTNIVGTYNLLEASRAYLNELTPHHREKFRFHHVSTDEVYGSLSDKKSFFTEESPYAPSSPYSASKAGSDHLVRAWHRTYSLPVVITNCSNNYGPYQFPEKLIPHMILNALAGKELPVYGDGEHIRDWLYVEDHAKALLKVLRYGSLGETYNIGGHNERTNLEVVQAICDILDKLLPLSDRENSTGGKSAPITASAGQDSTFGKDLTSHRELIKFVPDRPGHDRRYALDAGKIINTLGWQPEESFEEGLEKTVQWYLANEWWWRPLREKRYQGERLGQNC